MTAIVVALLATQAGMLAYSATRHSPTMLEPAQLAAGISNWEFGRFELFRVNPPLVRMIAALPVLSAECNTDWREYYDAPAARPEFGVGSDFVAANGVRSLWLFTIARWACIPITLLGGMFCFLWGCELYGHRGCGLLSLALWCSEPSILAHGELITTDLAATTFGLGATYLFWRWLKCPTWGRTAVAGTLMGLAQLSKMSWVFLFGLWPILAAFWHMTAAAPPNGDADDIPHRASNVASQQSGKSEQRRRWIQLTAILLLALYVLNVGYAFDGTFSRLKEFTFVSQLLNGKLKSGIGGNCFKHSWVGQLPLPVPRQYMLGLDCQLHDFEDYRQPSYLCGEWRDGGWWYYYLYGLLIKTPHGHQLLLVMVLTPVVSALYKRLRQWIAPQLDRIQSSSCHIAPCCLINAATWRDTTVLLAPPITLFTLASTQLEFNHHLRYVLPVNGFVIVFLGHAILYISHQIGTLAVLGAALWSVISAIAIFPHQLAYFNEAAGGPMRGYQHLLGSNVDWGQDYLLLRDFPKPGPPESTVTLLSQGYYSVTALGVRSDLADPKFDEGLFAAQSGTTFIVSINCLLAPSGSSPRGISSGEEWSAMRKALLDREPAGQLGYGNIVYGVAPHQPVYSRRIWK